MTKARRFVCHQVATHNVEYGHDVATHVQMILWRFNHYDLDVLLLQENRDYRVALARAAREHGFALVHFGPSHPGYRRGMDQQAILVRDPHLLGRTWTFAAGLPFGRFLAMFPVAAIYDGVLYVSVHAPVGAKARGGRFRGAASRVAAYVTHTRRLDRLVRNHAHRPVVIGGDWNAGAHESGPGTPRAMAHRLEGVLRAPVTSTGHGIIDYYLGFRCSVLMVMVQGDGKFGGLRTRSDHRAVGATVRASV